ncbi:MAG: glycoside hydrolase family 3 N-terminal domain-containing protein [Sediminibacterium sp.]
MKKLGLIICMFACFQMTVNAQTRAEKKWVKHQFKSLSLDEKIAQLMVLRAHSNWEPKKIDSLADLIKQYNIGGLCFFQGGPVRQAIQTNNYQKIAKTPLLITIDAEWGVGMRLDSVEMFPRQLSLGAMPNNQLVYQMGAAIAAQCKRLGIQVNYAPDVDINNNPANPVINDRSFGQNKKTVIDYGIAYMKGMQDNGVMATAKHFPGHGDVSVDSHVDIPVVNKSREALDSMEIAPFKALIDAGIESVMVAHLSVPAIDNGEKRPTSLSSKAINGLLKTELGFKGIAVTDALDMKAISNYYPEGEANVQAILAGNDMLCLPGDIGQSIKKVKEAISEGRLSVKDIDSRVKKVLSAKFKYGLSQLKAIDTVNIIADLNQSVGNLKATMAKQSLTFVNANQRPIIKKGQRIAYLVLNATTSNTISNALSVGYDATVFFSKGIDTNYLQSIEKQLIDFDQVIVGVHSYNRKPANHFEIPNTILQFLNRPGHESWTHIVFGNPYAVADFPGIKNILFAYEDNIHTENAAVLWLEGKIDAVGVLPVTVTQQMPYGLGNSMPSKTVTNSQNNTVTSIQIDKLNAIDSLVADAIKKKALPGCQVLVAKDNQIVFNKSYGTIAGEGTPAVTNQTYYDLASVTKVSATTVAIMKLVEEGKVDIDKTIGDYLPWVKGNAKANISLRDLLLHQAGLYPYIKFYEKLLNNDGSLNKDLVSSSKDATHQQMITPTKFLVNYWIDSIQQQILRSPVTEAGKYIYSDNDFIFLGWIVEKVSGMSLQSYTTKNFYEPLGMTSTGFLPLQKTTKENIAATELDNYFRNELIQGSVHDEGASTMGGIAGHAGLFSNATDLAKLYLMLLNEGQYEGKKYLNASTIKKYTAYNTPNSRRGLGFDKPEKDNKNLKEPYPSASVSSSTFGHTGFTGTCVWADPEHQLLYIFLSNRVFPTRDNKAFSSLNLRPKIQEVIYSALLK